MKLGELHRRLINENIPEIVYSLNGGLPNEKYCLFYNGKEWEVYYSERGNKTSLRLFDTEDVACENFYQMLKSALKN